MSLNKPKYTLLKNTQYALSGLKDIVINESSFRVQIFSFIILQIVLIFLPLSIAYKIILSLSLFIPILAEIVNSAIERVVDLVTLEYHDMAKRAKDVGATIVFVSIAVTFLIWISILYLSLIQPRQITSM